MSESTEPSYYEIALTHRQVLVAFVLLLSSVLAAFLGGVWLGRSDRPSLSSQRQLVAVPGGEEQPAMQELKFFTEGNQGTEERAREEPLKRPDLTELTRKPRPETTLAQDVGSAPLTEPSAAAQEDDGEASGRGSTDNDTPTSNSRSSQPNRSAPARAAAPPETADGDRARPEQERRSETEARAEPPADSAPSPRAAAPASSRRANGKEPTDGFIIQVFSTRDKAQAEKVMERLGAKGYAAYLSPVEVRTQTMYRVRVGPFDQRSRAETVAREVREGYKLDTWITAAGN